MEMWDQDAIDLVQPGFIKFSDDGLGQFGFIAVNGELDCRNAPRGHVPLLARIWQLRHNNGRMTPPRTWALPNPWTRNW
jgi:hypothetical protein